MAAIFQNGRPNLRFSNISASSSLGILILVSKHTYFWGKDSNRTNCKHLSIRNWQPFSKMADQIDFFNILAFSSLGILILVPKQTFLGARIPIELFANTYLHDICSQELHLAGRWIYFSLKINCDRLMTRQL